MPEIVRYGKPAKPLCEAVRKDGRPCRGRAVSNGRCAIHAGLLGDPVELGRKGGRARGKKAKRVPFEEQVEAELDEPGMGKRLLSSGAAGFRVAAEVLERRRAEKVEQAGPVVDDHGRPITTLSDVLRLAIATDQLELALDADILERIRAIGVEGAGQADQPESRSSGEPDPSTSASVDEQDPPEPPPTLETDDLVIPEEDPPAFPISTHEDSKAPVPKNESGS